MDAGALGARREWAVAPDGSAARERANAHATPPRALDTHAAYPRSREASDYTSLSDREELRLRLQRALHPTPGNRPRPAAPNRSNPAISHKRRS